MPIVPTATARIPPDRTADRPFGVLGWNGGDSPVGWPVSIPETDRRLASSTAIAGCVAIPQLRNSDPAAPRDPRDSALAFPSPSGSFRVARQPDGARPTTQLPARAGWRNFAPFAVCTLPEHH